MVLAAAVLAAPARGEVTLTQGAYTYAGKTIQSVTMENEYLRLTLLPERGGMACELIDKRDAYVNVIYLSSEAGGYGGLFDDHTRRSVAPYALKVLAQSPERCAVELTSTLDEVTYTKTITLSAGRPMLDVQYTLSNAGQSTQGLILFRNVIRPSGGPLADSDLYVMPLTTGVQRGKGFGRSENIGAPWSGLVNVLDRRGVSVVYGGDKLRRFYSWNGGKTAPTYEWMFPALEPGQQYSTRFFIKLTHGFTGYSDSTPLYTADTTLEVKPDRAVQVTTRLAACWEALPAAVVEFRIHPVGEAKADADARLDWGNLAMDVPADRGFTWQAPADGGYVLEAVVSSNGKAIGRYEEYFTVGKLPKNAPAYERKVAWAGTDPVEAAPGWKKIERYTLQPSDAEKARGYLVYEEYGPNAGKELAELVTYVGMGEQESLNLLLTPLKEIGVVKLAVRAGTLPVAALSLTAAETAPQEIWGKTYVGQKLLGSDTLPTKPNETAYLWALLRTQGLKAGEYTATLLFTPENAPAKELPLRVVVMPVQFPEDMLVFFNPSCLFNYLISSGKYPDLKWDEHKGRLYAADMQSHGVRVMNMSSLNSPGRDVNKIKIRATGQPLMESIAKNPAAFQQGELPALDLSYWDWMINFALEYDQYICKTTLGNEENFDNDFLNVSQAIYGRKELPASSPEHARVRQWLLAAIPAYMKEKGYRQINATIGDEIPFDRFPKWAEKAREAKAIGFAPGVTTSLVTLMSPDFLRLLAGPSDFWVIGTLNDEALNNARKAGLIEPTDWVETYCSSANFWQTYETMRRWAGWWPAYFELDAVWIQEYWRWSKAASVIFPDDVSGPKTSGAWEGCRDGLEDANYYYMALDIVKALEYNPKTAPLGKQARAELDAISGKSKDSLVRFEYQSSREGNSLSCATTDTFAFREAKRRLLAFIIQYSPKASGWVGPVRWGRTEIVRDDLPQVALAFGKGLETAVAPLQAHIDARSAKKVRLSSVEKLSADKEMQGGLLLLLSREDGTMLDRLEKKGIALGLSATYPAAGSYVIRQVANPWTPDKPLIIIIGADAGGAARGAKNAAAFIRRVRAQF